MKIINPVSDRPALANIARHLRAQAHESNPTWAVIKTRLPFEALNDFLIAHGVRALKFGEGGYYRHAVVNLKAFQEATGLPVESIKDRDARRSREALERAKVTIQITGDAFVKGSSALAVMPGQRMFRGHMSPWYGAN